MTATTGTRLGPYEIVALIGAGGMGEVYKARDTRLNRDVAIKVLPESFAEDDDRLRRFQIEAQSAGALNHPNILAIYDIGTFQDSPYLVSELLEGESLAERLKGGKLSTARATDYARQIASGLAAAHAKGITHRDIKPDNIMVDTNGNYWLSDFGISRHLSMAPITPATHAFGRFTPGYAPPEQFRNVQNEIDARADLFAFGVTFYECATGRQPFQDGTSDPLEVLRRVENDSLPRLALSCNASSSLADLISALTQRRRDHRPATISDALSWLQSIVNNC